MVCRDGFPHVAFCRRGDGKTPWCLKDELPAHWIDERGLPLMAEHRLKGPVKP